MKIKTKLVISFCIIIFVPILLSAAVMFGFQQFQVRTITETYGLTDDDAFTLTNSLQLLSKLTDKEYQKYLNIAIDQPETLLDEHYLEK